MCVVRRGGSCETEKTRWRYGYFLEQHIVHQVAETKKLPCVMATLVKLEYEH